MCGMKLLIHFQTSTVDPLKFRHGWVNSSHTLAVILLLIHGGIKGKPCQWKGPSSQTTTWKQNDALSPLSKQVIIECDIWDLKPHFHGCQWKQMFTRKYISTGLMSTLWVRKNITLCPSYAICCHKTGSTLVKAMACYQTVSRNPSIIGPVAKFLDQYRLVISKVQWHPSEGNFIPTPNPHHHARTLVWKKKFWILITKYSNEIAEFEV